MPAVKLSLKLKVSLIAAAAIMVLAAVVAWTQDWRLARDFREVLDEQQDALAESMADHLSDKLHTYMTVLEAQAAQLDAATLRDAAARQAFLSRPSPLKALFDALALVDLDGNLVANEPPLPPGRHINVADREYFQRMRSQVRSLVSEPIEARTGAGPAILLAVPVTDAQGRLQAMLVGGLRLLRPNLLGLMSQAPVGRTGHFEIVTRGPEPVYVIHPDPSRILRPAQTPALGDAHAVVTRKIVALADWELRVVLPGWEVRAPVIQAQRALASDLALYALAAAAFVWAVMRWMLQPLAGLHRAIHILRRDSQANVAIDTRSRDERGDLARDFQALLNELRSRERERATLFEASTDYIIQTDARGRLLYLNPAARRVLGLAPDQPVHNHVYSDFNTAQTNEQFRQEIVPAVLKQGHWVGETGFYDAQGHERRVSHLVIAHRDDAGRITHFSGVMRDITDQADMQRQAQRQAAMLRSVADRLPTLVAVVGADERVRYVNRAYALWLQRSESELLGQSLDEVLGLQHANASRAWWQQALAGEEVQFEREHLVQRERRCLRVSCVPLRLDDGSVDGFVEFAHDVTTHKAEAEHWKSLAEIDPLTGLLNRAGFEARLRALTAQDSAAPGFALVYLDLDHFKPVNDTHGHPVGDEVLRLFAQRLQRRLRAHDSVARIGGDEFAVLLPGVQTEHESRVVADKLLEAAHQPFRVGERVLHIGASAGLALWPTQAQTLEQLVARADAQLYRAKQAGRGRVSVAE